MSRRDRIRKDLETKRVPWEWTERAHGRSKMQRECRPEAARDAHSPRPQRLAGDMNKTGSSDTI